MNNEIGRKLTSLTLMTIMLASAFAAGAPSVMPSAAAANANLFVSAESSQFQNYFAGPMVIEVVVIDNDIKDTDTGKGEPDVTVNGNDLRMVQATDGNWYAYFADRAQAQTADATVGLGDEGLDFGEFCSKDSTILGFDVIQTTGVAIPWSGVPGVNGTNTIPNCNTVDITLGGADINNVVREAKQVNTGSPTIGQIGFTNSTISTNLWPFIQLYNFNPTGNVVVQYNKGGGVQSTTLKFDTADQFAKLDLDRTSYPRGADVHVAVTDIQLNIDPTDEDSWTFQTKSGNLATVYQAFNENGGVEADGTAGYVNLIPSLPSLMFGNNGILILNPQVQGSKVITIQDNTDSELTSVPSQDIDDADTISAIGVYPVTMTETAPNTGVFASYDNDDKSVIVTTNDAARGKSASINYNEKAKTILVGFGFASVDIAATDAEWNSGEEIPVRVTDSDANKNSRADEDLDLNNPGVDLIPSLRIGNPFTLGAKGTETSTVAKALYFNNFTASTNNNGDNTNVGNGADSSIFAYVEANLAVAGGDEYSATVNVQKFSDRAILTANETTTSLTGLIIDTGATSLDLKKSINNPINTKFAGYNFVNLDARSINASSSTTVDVYLMNSTSSILTTNPTGDYTVTKSAFVIPIASDVKVQSLTQINDTNNFVYTDIYGDGFNRGIDTDSTVTTNIGYLLNFSRSTPQTTSPIVVDLFSFGYKNDGAVKADRINNMIVRVEAEETGDNTGIFAGSLEFVALNQLNILDANTYLNLSTIADDPTFVVHQNLNAEESPRVNYNDLGADGVVTQVSDQQDAPTHSGVVSFDKPTYKKADTVVVTLEDQDLNADVDLVDIYTVVDPINFAGDAAADAVGKEGLPTLTNGDPLGRLLDITFDDARWINTNNACNTLLNNEGIDVGLYDSGFTLIETGSATGIFKGDYQVPGKVCNISTGSNTATNAQGLDMEVNYVDFRDASGQIVEVGDGAGIRANTGSVSLDRTVYPVPYGSLDDFNAPTDATAPNGRAIFPIHSTGIKAGGPQAGDTADIESFETLGNGDLTIHIQVNDPDYDTSATGEDKIAEKVTLSNGTTLERGPVKVTVSRNQDKVVLAYAGGPVDRNGVIDVADNNNAVNIRDLGPIAETTPSSGIFEFDLDLQYVDGPASTLCPTTANYDSLATPGTRTTDVTQRFDAAAASGNYCILQGDIITVEYTDQADASGSLNTITDSATFDLRNGALQSDKSVYIIGSDMIMTLIEADLDLDNDLAETYDLDLIEWDSDAATITIGDEGKNGAAFDPEPSDFRETGDSTGIFQSIIEIPATLDGEKLERGEEIVLEYTDWGPSGSDYVGQTDQDVNLTIFTSNFGATVELDQKVYTWTDKVYITVVAPDQNFDSNLIDEIGNTNEDPLKVATRGNNLNKYKLVETGTDTGIFTGEVILTGYNHDANGEQSGGLPPNTTSGAGPTSGYLQADNDDGLTVSYEFSEDETVVGSALIRWNIGEISWLEASYPATGNGVVRVVDPDMNLNPEAVDNFEVNVWSDSDAGGIDLTVTETNEATGIFEGTVVFTTTDDSSGSRLRVAEGDTVTAEYKDNTLPDPYTTADELDITGTSFIGTVVPPLERAPASNARVVDAFGNTLDEVSVDQQVQITADLVNGQDREQAFAYLVQIQDENGVTVSLAWITGSLTAGQSFSPALSWIPTASGTYTATVFVWESVDNPTALSPPVSVDITVS